MIVTITSLRLRKLWYFFLMSYKALFITIQARKASGFLSMKNTGFGYLHFTMTAWESEEEMRQFSRSGYHLQAMKAAAAMATEVRTLTIDSDTMPAWADAKEQLMKDGKVVIFESNSGTNTGNSAGAATSEGS